MCGVLANKMYLYWIVTLILVARTICEDYDQGTPEEYSDEDSESSSKQDGKYALTKINANHTKHDLKGKIQRLLNKTIIEESEENNLSRNPKNDDGNVNLCPYLTK